MKWKCSSCGSSGNASEPDGTSKTRTHCIICEAPITPIYDGDRPVSLNRLCYLIVGGLTYREALIYLMRVDLDMRTAEVAERLAVLPNGVRVALCHAKRHLKKGEKNSGEGYKTY